LGRLVRFGLVRLVVTYRAASRRPDLAVPGHVPGNAAHDRSLDASLGFRRAAEAKHYRSYTGHYNYLFHECSPIVDVGWTTAAERVCSGTAH
jgi:hypothetical protein